MFQLNLVNISWEKSFTSQLGSREIVLINNVYKVKRLPVLEWLFIMFEMVGFSCDFFPLWLYCYVCFVDISLLFEFNTKQWMDQSVSVLLIVLLSIYHPFTKMRRKSIIVLLWSEVPNHAFSLLIYRQFDERVDEGVWVKFSFYIDGIQSVQKQDNKTEACFTLCHACKWTHKQILDSMDGESWKRELCDILKQWINAYIVYSYLHIFIQLNWIELNYTLFISSCDYYWIYVWICSGSIKKCIWDSMNTHKHASSLNISICGIEHTKQSAWPSLLPLMASNFLL